MKCIECAVVIENFNMLGRRRAVALGSGSGWPGPTARPLSALWRVCAESVARWTWGRFLCRSAKRPPNQVVSEKTIQVITITFYVFDSNWYGYRIKKTNWDSTDSASGLAWGQGYACGQGLGTPCAPALLGHPHRRTGGCRKSATSRRILRRL